MFYVDTYVYTNRADIPGSLKKLPEPTFPTFAGFPAADGVNIPGAFLALTIELALRYIS
jgi:hypothetical protein